MTELEALTSAQLSVMAAMGALEDFDGGSFYADEAYEQLKETATTLELGVAALDDLDDVEGLETPQGGPGAGQ